MSTVRDKMSCTTVMYQPYAMSAYSTCDRPPPEKKSFRFPYVPSPPDSLHSDGSSYSSPGPSSGGTTTSTTTSRRPMTPCLTGGGVPGITSPGLGSSAPATITSAQLQHQQQQQRSPPHHSSHHSVVNRHHPHHHHHHSISGNVSLAVGVGNTSSSSGSSSSILLGEIQRSNTISNSNASSTSTSHSHNNTQSQIHPEEDQQEDSSPDVENNPMHSSTNGGNRAQYLSANCVVYENYRGDAARVVEDHFTRALSASYSNEKGSKCSPMTSRNFPPSFWNSNYQPPKPIVSYGPSDFYGAAVDYGPSLSGLSHHHQTDPWHYPLTSHQGYHHRPTDLTYPPMPSTSRFNAAQYGSFLLAGAAASSSSSRFHGIPGSSQCGVKGDTSAAAWASGRYHHPHDSISDLHLDYNYSAAAAAAYSNMTAGLETTVGQESSKDAAYWF